MLSDSNIKSWILKKEGRESSSVLLILEAQEEIFHPFEWANINKPFLENYLVKYGGVLLRNFSIYSVSEFDRIVRSLCPNLLDYTYRSTPRTKLGGKIYTATEYPASRNIPLHNENSYSMSWPQKVFFFSMIVASEGGATPLADSRTIYKRISPQIKAKFEKYGVMYTRNYSKGIDLSWQEVFQTEEKEEVERYCQRYNINLEWRERVPELTTWQTCQATLVHPTSRELVCFTPTNNARQSVV